MFLVDRSQLGSMADQGVFTSPKAVSAQPREDLLRLRLGLERLRRGMLRGFEAPKRPGGASESLDFLGFRA